MDPQKVPPLNEDRETVDPVPGDDDSEGKEHRPDKPDGGPESEPTPDSPETTSRSE